MNTSARQRLNDNLAGVEERIANACARSGRSRSDVTLIAVTKTVSTELALLLPDLGVFHLGENRPQELWRKTGESGESATGVRWHLIGHLQRNKIERTLPLVTWIHSVDSLRLLQAIEAEAAKQKRTVPVLLEINASGEASKQGFPGVELDQLATVTPGLKHVQVRGLMTMAALQNPEKCRPTFRVLREMRDTLLSKLSDAHRCEHLSMGMSNDFEIAIEEGATFIRLGAVLFEGVP
ncbi:MAG: YggS family pyridoxal phosphate-dependent enzyme [Planctomycetes bacterium]|nr:YggS family pyridoxal phosphate-dependent enzyme [Planctomycetota bacterium]